MRKDEYTAMKHSKWSLLIALALVCLLLPVFFRAGAALAFEGLTGMGGGEEENAQQPAETQEEQPAQEPQEEAAGESGAAEEQKDDRKKIPSWNDDFVRSTSTPTAKPAVTATPKPGITLYIQEVGRTSKVPAVKRYQPVTLVSAPLTMLEKDANAYNKQGVTLEIINSSRITVRTETAYFVKEGKQYILQCALTDTGDFAKGRYTVKVTKAPAGFSAKYTVSPFIFEFEDPAMDFSVQGERTGTDGVAYWLSADGQAQLVVSYEPGSENSNTFEYAVYPTGEKTFDWITPDKISSQSNFSMALSDAAATQEAVFSIAVPQDAWSQPYTVAVRRNGQEVAAHEGVFQQPLAIALGGENALAGYVFRGAESMVLTVNRTSGDLVARVGDQDEWKASVSADGTALFDLSKWNMQNEKTITVRYANITTGEASEEGSYLTLEIADASPIEISPMSGVYIDGETNAPLSFQVLAELGLTARIWLEDAEGNRIGQAVEGVDLSEAAFFASDLSKAAQMAWEYPLLRDSRQDIPIVSLGDSAASASRCILVVREGLILDQAAIQSTGGKETLTGKNGVPGRRVELLANGTIVSSATADEQGAFSFTIYSDMADRELTVKCTDALGQARFSGTALVLPLQAVTVRADSTQKYIYLDETTNTYSLNYDLTTLPLQGTAHRNQKLRLLLNGNVITEDLAADENGEWQYALPLDKAVEKGTVTVQYQAMEGPEGTMEYAFHTSQKAVTLVSNHIVAGQNAVEAIGDAGAVFTLNVNGVDKDQKTAGDDGHVVLTLKDGQTFAAGDKVIITVKDIVDFDTLSGEYTVEAYEALDVTVSGSAPYYLTPDGSLTLNVQGNNGSQITLYANVNGGDRKKLDEWTLSGKAYTLQYAFLQSKLSLGQSEQEIPLIVEDKLGNQKTITVVYDPGCALRVDDSWTAMTKKTEQITGWADPGATVTLLSGDKQLGQATADESGAFTLAITDKPRGWAQLQLMAVDPAGNQSPVIDHEEKIHFPEHGMLFYLIPMGMSLLLFAAFLIIFLSARKNSRKEQDKPPLPTGTVRLPSHPRK